MSKKIPKYIGQHFDFTNSIKILVCPTDFPKGFACGILIDTGENMSIEDERMCAVIARGMIRHAVHHPHKIFVEGVKGLDEDNEKTFEQNLRTGDLAGVSHTNLVDLSAYLKKKKFKKEDLN